LGGRDTDSGWPGWPTSQSSGAEGLGAEGSGAGGPTRRPRKPRKTSWVPPPKEPARPEDRILIRPTGDG
jgi:hypothetical protein